MRSGDFDTQILIEKRTTTPDPKWGTPVVTWVPLVTSGGVGVRFRAIVEDQAPSRSESVRQGLAMARNQTTVRIRWRKDIDSSMRVTIYRDDGGTLYQIVGGPAMVGRKQLLEMVLEKYSTTGTPQ